MGDGMKQTVIAIAVGLALTGLAACGNASAGDAVSQDKAPDPAPSAYGRVDFNGESLQCSRNLAVTVTPDYSTDPVGFTTVEDAALDAIKGTLREDAAAYLDATTHEAVAAAAVDIEDAEADGAVNVVEVDFTNKEGEVKGVVLVHPNAKGGAWLGGQLHLCDGGEVT
jgi:hypothetical protein